MFSSEKAVSSPYFLLIKVKCRKNGEKRRQKVRVLHSNGEAAKFDVRLGAFSQIIGFH